MKKIIFKQIGQNIILKTEENTYSKRIIEKTNREEIKKLIENYNSKPSKTTLNKILKYFKKEDKEKLQNQSKKEKIEKVKKIEKEKTNKPSNKELQKAKKLLQDNNYNVTAKTAAPTKRYRGEH